ncbi:heat shock protein 75 kDa, mitochondrial-like [Tubulanus polymorphus]|uniref:heat shock protein 75 kDa, mitochondrial-like n=1 Tax=Tubulanus polymorphus TaxID=672921 RepID=UPI003DA5115A
MRQISQRLHQLNSVSRRLQLLRRQNVQSARRSIANSISRRPLALTGSGNRVQIWGSQSLIRLLSTDINEADAKKDEKKAESEVESTIEGNDETTVTEEEEYHSIIKDSEKAKGPADKHEFQAETKKLLDIVARSLYSEKEVFIRELISNSNDALEKLRYLQMTDNSIKGTGAPLEIHIRTDDSKKTFTIQDTGVGMTKAEMIENLGTIAKSGSKAFMDSLKDSEPSADMGRSIIGQFGVGFYSTFMVGDKVTVYSASYKPDSPSIQFTSDGTGSYEVTEADGVQRGTKIVVHLKGDCYDYCKEDIIKSVITKYSNFVGAPIFLNGKKINVIEALWTKNPREVTEEQHEEFYRFISKGFDRPRYTLHYKTEAPLDIKALFYIPETKPTLFDMGRDIESGVSLYSRKIMIMSRVQNVLPKWMRFMKGVIDSEDIPLNLSRELLQESALIRKLRSVLTSKVLKFLQEQANKDPEKYLQFYDSFGIFFREAVVTSHDQPEREEISKLFRYESSALPKGTYTSLEQYATRMKSGTREIYFFSAPSRELAETSPYFELMKKKEAEVLFCYEPYDELVLLNLGEFDRKKLISIENVDGDKDDKNVVDEKDPNSLSSEEADGLQSWLRVILGTKVKDTKITHKLVTHPCILTMEQMSAARHFLRTTLADRSEEEKNRLLQPIMEINPTHPVIKKLYKLRTTDEDLAKLVALQIYDNAMIAAGLLDDPRVMLNRLNDLLIKSLEKID